MAELESEDIEMLKGKNSLALLFFLFCGSALDATAAQILLRNGQHKKGAFSSDEVGGTSFCNMSWYLSVELGSLTTANLMEKVRGLQNLAYQLGLEECEYTTNTLTITSGLSRKHVWETQPFTRPWNRIPLQI